MADDAVLDPSQPAGSAAIESAPLPPPSPSEAPQAASETGATDTPPADQTDSTSPVAAPEPAATPAPVSPSAIRVPAALAPLFDEAAYKSGVPKRVLVSIAKQESNFNPGDAAKTSSAKGIFQFTDPTWGDMMRSAAPLYGLPTGSSPYDPRASILMGAEFAKQNAVALKNATGRAPTDGEYYVMHFMGRQGGIDLIKAEEKNPGAPAAQLFPSAAQANHSIFYDKAGNPRSVGGVYHWLTGVVEGHKDFVTDTSSPINFGQTIPQSESQAPPLPPSQLDTMTTASQMAEREKDSGFFQAAGDAWSNTLTARMIDAATMPNFAPDPNYRITDADLKQARKDGVSDENLDSFGRAVSPQHFQWLKERALQSQQKEEQLANYGLTGTALKLTASILDPVAMAAGVATGGLGDMAAAAGGLSNAARVAVQAGAGAVANVAVDEGLHHYGDPAAGQNLLHTAVVGALFGAAFGALSENPATALEAQKMERSLSSLRKQLKDSAVTYGAAGGPAAFPAGAAPNPHVDLPFLNDKEWLALSTADVAHAFGGKARFSTVGQLKSSENPAARLAGVLGEDAVGGSKESLDVLNPVSTSERAEKRFRSWWADFENTYEPAYKEWAKENNLGVVDKMTGMGRFGSEVTRYIRTTDPAAKAEFSPAVQRAGDKLVALNKDALNINQNPLRDSGGVGRPTQGFDTVPENENYMMRVTDGRRLNEMVDTYSERGLQNWYEGAIRSAQPWIEDDVVSALAAGTVRNMYKRANHIDEKSNLMFSGYDQGALKELLAEQGLDDDKINRFLGRMEKDDQPGADTRAKHRILLNENYELPYPKRNGGDGRISLSDFTVTDAYVLSHQYFKHMAGRAELSATRIKNPKTGELLADGFTSDSDLAAYKNRLRQMAGELKVPKEQTDKDIANLDWLYDRILGRPDQSQLHPGSNLLRTFRKFNFLRLMGQVGFSQIQDYSSAVAQLGLKAVMQHVPSFRRIINMDGEQVLKNGLAKELEAIFGRDGMNGMTHFRDPDFAPSNPGAHGKLDNFLSGAERVMAKASGLDVVNAALMRMTQKSIVQKFADLARNPSKANMRRMMSLGLDDGMMKRILDQTKHFTQEQGPLFGLKVTKMNLGDWEDGEARAAFENAVFRWSRRIIQENDYGSMHRWSSNPLWQTLFQFRSFALSAYEKQFLHNVAMRDMTSFHMMWMSMALAAATYAVRTNLQAMGRSDKDQFLKDRLAPNNLAGAAFQLAGWSSILPMAMDSGLRLSGFNPWFDFRSSGQPTDALLGNPTMDFINTIGSAMKGTVQSTQQHRQMSQQEIRNWTRIAPFGNWAPVVPVLNSMISNRAPYAPKQ